MDWQRLLLTSVLWPLLWLKAVRVRRVSPSLLAIVEAAPCAHFDVVVRSIGANDGIHPSAGGYAVWAEGLSPHILARVASGPFSGGVWRRPGIA